ncbi:hypothetical protein IQ07DRAFT_496691 [Pyrenochaeta sp. DS3sAY3a]|nr:hypothetical protein IQ07DRAFT_496691 [Pyrenochaeta sp. DS3sAY3a]
MLSYLTYLRSLNRRRIDSNKRVREEDESWDDARKALKARHATAVALISSFSPNANANDIWPEYRNVAKLPVHYALIDPTMMEPPPSKLDPLTPSWKAARSDRTKKIRLGWGLPVELVEMIASHVVRDDVKALRLVCRELNQLVSQVIFKTVVVPFNTEIYGMLGPEPKPDLKGKGRAKSGAPQYAWTNDDGQEIYNGHGLDVFRGFGKFIRRFGMSFDVDEFSLSTPPTKPNTRLVTSFWGTYEWPTDDYARFEAVAGLESAADETSRMTVAFSELSEVKELALSINSGRGWLNGPDRSIRARILQQPPAVFGTTNNILDRRAQAQQEFWDYVQAMHREAGTDVREATLYKLDRLLSSSETWTPIKEQPRMPYLDSKLISEATLLSPPDPTTLTSSLDPAKLGPFVSVPLMSGHDILFTSVVPPEDKDVLKSSIIPTKLTTAQSEWLLETEWAQRAFLSSYMLSVIDNRLTFQSVHTLNISQLSDGYLPSLDRSDFWSALPNLSDVTLMVLPEWRSIHKDDYGFVHTSYTDPAQGLNPFAEILRNQIAPRCNIRTLKVGWAAGGEHAEGMYARNRNLLPVPLLGAKILQDDALLSPRSEIIQFPHLEHLILKNCWITPAVLMELVDIHDRHSLEALTLDSISLTGILRPNRTPALFATNILTANYAQVLAPPLFAPQAAVNLPAVNPLVTNGPLQNQLHQLNQLLSATGLPQATISALQQQASLRIEPRKGSWVFIIDIISPGIDLSDFGSPFSRTNKKRKTKLQSIEFISCGYAQLLNVQLGQPYDLRSEDFGNPFFEKRCMALFPAMFYPRAWRHLGVIKPEIDPLEVEALEAGWNLKTGWVDTEAARAAEFDGCPLGGTGRFTGKILATDTLDEDTSLSS